MNELAKTALQERQKLIDELYLSGVLTLCVAPGLMLFGVVLAMLSTGKVFILMLGVSTLVGFVGVGLLLGGYVYKLMGTATD